jgi:uncharacterized membrane protein
LQRGSPIDARAGELLGLLSIALGVTALLAPRVVSRAAGMSERPLLLRAVGARELASGVGLLTRGSRTPWLWSRVLGHAFDATLVGSAALRPGGGTRRGRGLGALAIVAAIGAVDLMVSHRHSRRARQAEGEQPATGETIAGGREAYFEQAIVVGKSPQECYAFWRDFSNLPRFIPMLETVTMKDHRTSHWVVQMPGGGKLEWDAQITEDREGERIAWHSLPGSTMKHAGTVRFEPAPGGRGCIVRALVHFQPPLGLTGRSFAKAVGRDPTGHGRENLRRFKQLIETGEIPTTRAQPSGRRSWMGRLTREGRKSQQGDILQERRP